MSTCRWCTPGGLSTTDFLKQYASGALCREDFLSANDDLNYCLECVVEYHKARDEISSHKALWEMETARLIAQFEKTMKDQSVENEDLFFVEEDGETKLPEFVGPDFENNLRVPLLEILKYPYLLLDERISELCVEALCKMERASYSFPVFDKHPGIYLLLVHPNEMIRRWAIVTARMLGKVDRDDYYDLQEVFACLFKVIELGLFESPDIYSFYAVEKGKLILLPAHLYDTNNYKNYWLGICMLLTVLEEQAMDSLLLGPEKQNDFMQCILSTMEKDTAGDGDDPFWPALHCFMVILDTLGAKVWGQLIDPIQAFQTIIDSRSYKNEIENIRNSTRRTKIEPQSDYGDDQVTCSQIVYDFNTEKPKKDSGWRNAICPDYCPNMYEEMQTLANVLQSDIGQDMRVHNSTFLWFIPFVQSVMDLKDLGVAYIVEVIHHLYSEIKDVLNKRVEYCDKVTEFFILILVSVIELHRNKKCLHLLWVSSQKWVEALVKCAMLPSKDFRRYSEMTPGNCTRISSTSPSTVLSMHSQATNSVQYSCMQLIRGLLREGSQLGQQSSCKRFLDKLNILLRGNAFMGLQLSEKEMQDMQMCLKQVIRISKDRNSFNANPLLDQSSPGRTLPLTLSKIKREDTDEWARMKAYCQTNSPSPPSPAECRINGGCSSSPPLRIRNSSCGEEAFCKGPSLCEEGEYPFYQRESGCNTPHVRDDLPECFQETKMSLSDLYTKQSALGEHWGTDTSLVRPDLDQEVSAFTRDWAREDRCTPETKTAGCITADPCPTPYNATCDSSTEKVTKHSSMSEPPLNPLKLKIANVRLADLHLKLAKAMEKSSTFLKLTKGNTTASKDTKHQEFISPCQEKVHSAGHLGSVQNLLHSNGCVEEHQTADNTGAVSDIHIKQEPEESCVDTIGMRSKASDRVSESDSDDGIPLSQRRVPSSKNIESSPECSLYKKIGLSTGQLASDGKREKSPDKAMGESPVKLRDHPFVLGTDLVKAGESDSDDSMPLTLVQKKLLNRRKLLTPNVDTAEDSDIESGHGRMSIASRTDVIEFSSDSKEEHTILQPDDHIERKVRTSLVQSLAIEKRRRSACASKEIIVISDSTSEEETDDDTILNLAKHIKKEPLHEDEHSDVKPMPGSPPLSGQMEVKQEVVEKQKSPERCDEYDSQFFEFETEDEVYSVWQDSEVDHPPDQMKAPTSAIAVKKDQEELEMWDKYTEWGYDTDYIPEEVIEEAMEAAQEQLAEKEKANRKPGEFEKVVPEYGQDSLPIRHTALALADENTDQLKLEKSRDDTARITIAKTKLAPISKPSNELFNDTVSNAGPKEPAKLANAQTTSAIKSSKKLGSRMDKQKQKKCASTTPKKTVLPRTTPAVVPPKKDRKLPEPSSAVEKLGFKKPPRRAFDLSQRSLDSLAELRNHGKNPGSWGIKHKTKPKIIAAQALPVKGNRKLLACQDRQFYRQMRPKEGGKAKTVETSKNSNENKPLKTVAKLPKKTTIEGSASTENAKSLGVGKTLSGDTLFSNQERYLNIPETYATDVTQKNKNVNIVSPITRVPAASDCKIPASKGARDFPSFPSALPTSGAWTEDSSSACPASTSSDDAQGRSLQGANAVSGEDEEEMEEDHLFLTQPDPVDMEICSQSENVGGIETWADNEQEGQEGNAPVVLPTNANHSPEHYQCKHSECAEVVKMPGFYCRKHIVVDTSADHVFAMPGLPSPAISKSAKPPTAKVFSSVTSSRSANLSKELENNSKAPAALRPKSQVSKPAPPKMNPPMLIKDMTSRHRSPCSVLQDLNNQSNIALGWQTARATTGSESGQHARPALCASYSPTKPRDQSFLIQEILCWSHEMFTSFNQFGAPNNLSQFTCGNVPLWFSAYEEYFRIFFPLLLLNTFEMMVQEWQENQRRRSKTTYQLQLQNFCTDVPMNRVDFQVWIRDADLAKQFHLKEDDLVFLRKPQDSQLGSGDIHYIGHVARFTRSQLNETRNGEKHTSCHLSIQSKGNFSGARNQLVMCELIGGLVSTQRQFKALLALRWSPLAKPIINPNPPEFLPRTNVNLALESNLFPYFKDYNDNQNKAIETAYAMVKLQPGLPHICLIHGPPGTGKSKTIVGLLHRILTENSNNEARAQSTNVKNKRNRVLVCAPSNASIDELMKKIIVGFKEKCKNKTNVQGNCGDINLVRLGTERNISSDVQRFSLDSQVSRRMNKNAFGLDQDIQKKKEALDQRLDELSRQRAIVRCDKRRQNEDLDQEIGRVAAERQQLAGQLKQVRKHLPEVQGNIILESDVICCTLNTSGSFLLESAFRRLGHDPFSCVIVDEAGQACEVETLIPLIHRCSKLILVGDPEQLPATVISTKAEDYGYGQSMMARLCTRLEKVTSKTPVLQLTVQYRMHPDICLFPSTYIYGKTLRTDRLTEEIRCSSDWPFQPYLLFDVLDGTERREKELSYVNNQEVKLVIAVIKLLKDKKGGIDCRHIGIITPYRAQKNMILKELEREFGASNRPAEVDTVDGFQGRQKDCIIVTCVRANSCQSSIGFLASRQRLNVTITRAKSSLFILGSLTTLMENRDWNELIQDAQKRGAIIKTREENYTKDVTKILKLKPSFMRSHSFPSTSEAKQQGTSRPQCAPPRTERKEATNGSNQFSSVPPPLPAHRPVGPQPKPVQQPLESKWTSAAAPLSTARTEPMQIPVLSAPMERPRDPRLARKCEASASAPHSSQLGNTLPGTGHPTAQTSSILPHRSAVGSSTSSRNPNASSTSNRSRSADSSGSWQASTGQGHGNWMGNTENRQWDRHRDNRNGSRKREYSHPREDPKRRKTSNYDP
ncbi:probable helicase senataxin [Ambystoma mexicanum]|uniref:probable helicase senataxin n=1 Tax=Ambystoma mexicanum TaxID=8296 RepID=UPI0037E92B38